MKKKRLKRDAPFISQKDLRRRKRELILIPCILLVVALLTFMEIRVISFSTDFPISNTILMFILININLLLIILLIFLVFRNLVKLFFDRRNKVMGARLRTRLVLAFISLTLLPTIILFFFSMKIITSSIEFWFNVPVEQALDNSLSVGRHFYDHVEENNAFFIGRIAYQINTKKLLRGSKRSALEQYIQVVQRAFKLDGVQVYGSNAKVLATAKGQVLKKQVMEPMSAEVLRKGETGKPVRSVSLNYAGDELIQTIGTVPYESKGEKVKAFIVLTTLIPQALTENMNAISKGYEEYQQIKLLKKPIQSTYYITLSAVALLVVFLCYLVRVPAGQIHQRAHSISCGRDTACC